MHYKADLIIALALTQALFTSKLQSIHLHQRQQSRYMVCVWYAKQQLWITCYQRIKKPRRLNEREAGKG